MNEFEINFMFIFLNITESIFPILFSASLVPVISFGENDVYQTAFKEEMNLMQRIQQKLVTMMTFPIPIIFGNNFQYCSIILIIMCHSFDKKR